MKVCVIRNTQLETNAGLHRIVDALAEKGVDIDVLSRNRFVQKRNEWVLFKNYSHNGTKLKNYEIQQYALTGKGLSNIWQLSKYQSYMFRWLLRNGHRYDVFHVFDLDAGIPALMIARLKRKK